MITMILRLLNGNLKKSNVNNSKNNNHTNNDGD